jgi:glucose/mannose-6-phosphate isomerase
MSFDFEQVIKEAEKFSILESFNLLKDKFEKVYDFSEFDNLVITGMGASGIIGDIIKDLFRVYFPNKVVIVNKTYELPKFIDKSFLSITISFSGKTEETLNVLKQSLKKGLNIVFISSNSEIKEFSYKNNYFPLVIPKTQYPPRYNLVPLLIGTLSLFLELDEIKDMFNIVYGKEEKQLIEKIIPKFVKENKIPVVYSGYEMRSVPLRIKQQFNENLKIHCIQNYFSEANHNELEVLNDERFIYFFLRSNYEHERIKKRFEIVKEIYKRKNFDLIEIKAKGKDLLKQMLYLLNLFDLITISSAILLDREFNKNNQISYLKEKLKE